MKMFKKDKLPEIEGIADKVLDELIKRLQGGSGGTMNITINNYMAKDMKREQKKEKKQDDPGNVFESPESVKGENFIKD